MIEVILDSIKAGVWTAIFCGLTGLYNRAQADERTVEWRMLPELELQSVCAPRWGEKQPANGCFRESAGTCIIYTRIISPINEIDVHRTLGHELRHCFQGRFHS